MLFSEFSYVKDDRNAFEANLKDNEKRRTDISYQLYDLQEIVDEQTVGFYFFFTRIFYPRQTVNQLQRVIHFVIIKWVRLPDGHLVRIPYVAV